MKLSCRLVSISYADATIAKIIPGECPTGTPTTYGTGCNPRDRRFSDTMRWPERAILNSRGLSQTISPLSGGFIADLNVDKGHTSPVRGQARIKPEVPIAE
jgi:hypothetical protein